MPADLIRSGSASARPGPPAADAVLAERAAAGDRGAFEQIYRRHTARVYGLCLRLTGERDRAEILTQDTFVKAWLSLGGYSGQAPLGAWLGRIAVNHWRDQWRADRRARRWLVDLGDDGRLEQVAAPGHGATTTAGDATIMPLLAAMDLERAVAKLPEGARTIFVLHGIEGYPQDEIATLLGVSEGTIKSQMHRARTLLRAMFTEPRRAHHEG
jgi:RNA polymerase sigma-70 factor (ECF subfamily)